METITKLKKYPKDLLEKELDSWNEKIIGKKDLQNSYFCRGYIYKRLKNFEVAYSDITHSVNIKPTLLNLRYLGDLQYRRLEYYECIETYEEVLKRYKALLGDSKKQEYKELVIKMLNTMIVLFQSLCLFDQMDIYLEIALEIDKDHERTLYNLADFMYTFDNNFQIPLKIIERAYIKAPDDLRVAMEYALLLFDVREKKKSAEILENARGMHCNKSYFYFTQSKFYEKENKWEEAVKCMDIALKCYKKPLMEFSIYYARKAMLLGKLHRFEEAFVLTKIALKLLRPKDSITRQSVLKDIVFLLFEHGKVVKSDVRSRILTLSRSLCGEIIDLNPSNPIGHNLLGIYMFDQLMDFNGAIRCFKNALETIPLNSTITSNLGSCYVRILDFDTCVGIFKRAISLNEDIDYNYNYLGEYYYNKDQLDLAKKFYKKAIDMSHTTVSSYHYDYASCLQKMYNEDPPDYGDISDEEKMEKKKETEFYKQYMIAINEILKDGKMNVDTYNMLGNCYFGLLMFKEAIKYYDCALKMHPNNYVFYQNKCNSYSYLDNYDKSIEVLHDGLAILGDDHFELLLSLGTVYNYSCKYKESVEVFLKIYKLFPERKNEEVIKFIIKNYYSLKEDDNLMKWYLIKADKYKLGKDWAFNEFGDYLYCNDKKEKSIEWYEKSLDLKYDGLYVSNIRLVFEDLEKNKAGIDYLFKFAQKLMLQEELSVKSLSDLEDKAAREKMESVVDTAKNIQSLGGYKQSLKIYSEVYERVGGASILTLIADCYDHMNEYEKAIEYYIKAVEKDNSLQSNVDSMEKIILKLHAKDKEEVSCHRMVKEVSKLLEKCTTRWLIKTRAEVYSKLKEIEKCISDYEWLVKFSQEEVDKLKEKYVTEPKIMKEKMERILKDKRDAHNSLGILHYNQGEFNKGITEFDKAIESDPTNHVYHYNKAYCLKGNHQLTGSLEELKKSIALNEFHVESYNLIALIKYQQDDINASIEWFTNTITCVEKLKKKYGERNVESGAVYYRNRASCYKNLKKFAECISDFEKCLELETNISEKITYSFEKVEVLLQSQQYNSALNDLLFLYMEDRNEKKDDDDEQEGEGEGESDKSKKKKEKTAEEIQKEEENNRLSREDKKKIYNIVRKISLALPEYFNSKESEQKQLFFDNDLSEFGIKHDDIEIIEVKFETLDSVFLNKIFCTRVEKLMENNAGYVKEIDENRQNVINLKRYLYGLDIDFTKADVPVDEMYKFFVYARKFNLKEIETFVAKKARKYAEEKFSNEAEYSYREKQSFVNTAVKLFKCGEITSVFGLRCLKVLKKYFKSKEEIKSSKENNDVIMMIHLFLENELGKCRDNENYVIQNSPENFFTETLCFLHESKKGNLQLVSNCGERVDVLREVVVFRSEYFRTLLRLNSSYFFESQKDNEIPIDVSVDVLKSIVHYLYTRKWDKKEVVETIDEEKINEYLTNANKYLLFGLEMLIKCELLTLKTKEYISQSDDDSNDSDELEEFSLSDSDFDDELDFEIDDTDEDSDNTE